MKPIDKIPEYFGLADIDYLSARLLILNGLPTVGLAKSAEAFEKQLKLFFVLYERIQNKRELTVKDFKKFGHGLLEMLEHYNSLAPTHQKLGKDWVDYFTLLENAYNNRYPEHWKKWEMRIDLGQLDKAYTYFRNLNLANTPNELSERAAEFGTFLGEPWKNKDYIKTITEVGLKTPFALLELENYFFNELKITTNK